MKKFLSLLFLFIVIQSCDDKKTQQFGGVSLTIQKQTYEEGNEVENEVDVEVKLDEDDFELTPLKNKEIKTNVIQSDDVFRSFRVKNKNDLDNNLNLETSENQITDIDAVRVTLNNGQPTTVPIINGSASYSRNGLAVGVIPIKVDLLGGGLEKYTQTKSVSIVANQNASVSFNSFFIMNQQISITNSSFGNTVVQGDQISFEWTNTHAEQPVQIAVIQNNDTNIIQTLESSYIGTSYVLNTTNSNPTNNIGFKVISNVASNTSSSICCFDLVANAPQANDISSTVNEDTSVTIQLDGSSPGGESVTYSIVSNPSNGSLSGISGSNVTYTPNQDYNGSDSFTYKVNNGSQDSNVATVTLTINAVNDAPVVENISTSTGYEQVVSIELNGSDVDNDNLTYNVNTNPSNGTIAFTGNSTIAYNPNSGFSGSDSFTYSVNDGSLDSNVATVSITVKAQAVQVTYPEGGEEFIFGETIDITWNGGFSNTGVYLIKGEQPRLSISGDVGGANSYQWTIPSSAGLEVGSDYKIRIYDAGAGEESSESNTFTITDSSTGGNPTYSENNNSSLLFGEDSVIKLTEIDEDLGKIGSSMTISLWFKTTHNPNQDVLIHGNGSSAQFGHLGFTTAGAGGKAYLVSAGGTNIQLSDSNDFTNDRNWNHMAYVIDGDNSNIRFYVNGVLENSDGFSSGASFNAFDRQWEIGHWTMDNNQNFDFQGYIDDVGVWNTNLSDQEIADIYNDGNPTLAHKIKESNLRAYYDFENSSMSNKTGREINGTPIGNPILSQNVGFSSDVPGQFEDGASGKFNSSLGGRGISISPAGEVFSNEFTVSFYLKVDLSNDSNDKVHGILRSLLGSTTPGFALRLPSNSGKLDFTYSDSSGETNIYSDFSLIDNSSWNHFTVVKNNNTVDFYVNGSLDKSHSVAFTNIANAQAYIGSGSFAFSDSQHLNGLLDEFAFWDNSLNANQISTLASSGSPLGIMDGSLKMYYQFNANEGSNIIDHSGNNNNGIGDVGFSYSSDVPGTIDVNNAPTTEDINVTIDENRTNRSMIDITLKGNDADGDDLSYYLTSTPNNGSFSITGNVLTYNAYQDWNGVEVLTYKANDGIDDSNTSTITITVNAVNDDPVVTVGTSFDNTYSGLFNGNSRINIGTRGDLSGQDFISVQAWVAPNTSSQEIAATVMAKGTNVNNSYRQYGIYLNQDSGQLAWSWSVSTENGEKNIYSSNVAEISEWTHLVGTYDGSVTSLYVNGVLSSSSAHSGNINAGFSTDKSLLIGHLTGGGQYYFKGNIDEVAIWDAVLSQSQVEELYNYGEGRAASDISSSTTPLHAYWNFENNVEDQSGNNRHGTNEGVAFEEYFPSGQGVEYTTDEDIALNIDLTSYISDVDNDDLTIDVLPASNGILTTNGLIITYTPNLNFYGNDSFSWTVTDGTVSTASVITDIIVNSVNDAPITSNQTATTDKDTQIDITLSATDVENESLTFSVVTDASNGSTSLNDNIITYTPNSGYAGTDSFTFKANDGSDDSNISTVSITVNGEGNVTYEIDPSSTGSEQVESGSYRVYEIEVNENGSLKDIDITLSLTGERGDHLRYTNIVLTSPQNSRILLMGGDQNNVECDLKGGCITSNSSSLTSTKFTDSSSTYIYNGSPPFVGAYKPNESFSVFDGEEINGKWKLHVLNSEPNNEINVAAIEMELVYNPDQNGSTYIETNTSEFAPSASMGSSLTVSPSSTGIITIPVSLSRNQTIQDLDFEISLDGQRGDHLRYITINVDIGDSDNAQLVFRGDQTQSGGQSYSDNHGTMYKARFDAQTNTNVNNTLLHNQRVSSQNAGGDLTTFNGESISEFKIYVYNAEPNNSLSVDLSNTKVYIYNSTDNSIPIINGDYYVNGREGYISWIEVNHTSLDPLKTTGSGPFTITDAPTEGEVSTWHPCEDDGTGQGKISGSAQNSAAFLDCDTIGNWWLRYTASDDYYDSFDFKMVDIHGDESNVKTVNIFNTSNGNSASLSGSFPNQANIKEVPGTDFSAIAIGKEITYVFKSVAEVEKFNLGFFNGSTGLGDAVTIEENINGASSNVSSWNTNGIIYKFTLTEDDLLSTMPAEANRIQFSASANYYVYNSAGTLVPGSGGYWQGNYYPNYFPEANDINVSIDENTSIDITFDATDGDNDTLTYSIVTDASNGSTSLSNGVLTYTPNTDFTGSETITYNVNDGYVDSNEATVAIAINAVNEGAFTFPAGGEWLVKNRQYNVTWINGYSNVGVKLMTPIPNVANPTTTWDTGGLGNVTSLSYTPDPARTARGDYWLRIYDADDPSNNSKWFDSNTFGIDVNRAPSASTLSKTTVEDIAIEITLEGSDLNNDELTYTIASNPGNGTLGSINNTNKITYTPDVNFVGSDIFSYTVSDGELTATDNVILSITEDNYITLRDTTITIGHELTEPGGDPIVYFYMPTEDADYGRSRYSNLPLLEYNVIDDNSTPGEFKLKRDRDTWDNTDEHGANRIEFYVNHNQGEISTSATVQAFGPGNDEYKDSNIATVTINTVDKNQSKSVYMNGRNIGRIRIETDTTSGTSSTAMFWVKLLPTATAIDGSDNGVIAQWETGGTYSDKIYIDYSGDDGTNAPALFLSSYGNKHILLDNTDLEKWYHITLVNDTDDNNNKFQKVYIDGNLVRTINNSSSGTITNQLGYVTFGSPRIGFGDTSTSTAHIVLDDYAVFSSALTENDIETYMTSMTTSANNILHYYDFNAGNKACVIQNDHEFLDPVIWFMEDEQD